jgi:HEAT repeat protein
MSALVLAAIVVAQMGFLAAVFIYLVGRRMAETRRLALRASERARLGGRIEEALAGRLSLDAFAHLLPRHRAPMVTAALQDAAVPGGDAWERLAAAVHRSPWFGQTLRRAESRWWWRRLVAARLLATIGDEGDVPCAVRLLGDRHPGVRLAAVQLVKRLPHPDLLETFLDHAIEAPRVARQHYFDALAALRGLLVPILLRRLERPGSAYELRAILTLAGQLASPELLDHLFAFAATPSPDARTQVARALGSYPEPRARDALLTLLADPEWEVRTQAAASLGAIRALDARDSLKKALSDQNWWVRLRAAIALRQLGATGLEVLREVRGGADRFADEMAGYMLGLSDEAVAGYAA